MLAWLLLRQWVSYFLYCTPIFCVCVCVHLCVCMCVCVHACVYMCPLDCECPEDKQHLLVLGPFTL